MKIALPIENTLTLCKDNPHTAPKFAIYNIDIIQEDIHYSLHSIIENQLSKLRNNEFSQEERKCSCNTKTSNNIRHKCEHYSLVEMLSDCSYLLANQCCQNTKNCLKASSIKIIQIPPFIKQIDMAIKNFIIGGSFANKITQIHNAS